MHKIKKIVEQEEKNNLSIEAAKQIIIEAQQKKIKECSEEIEKVLDKFGFRLEVRTQIMLLPKQ